MVACGDTSWSHPLRLALGDGDEMVRSAAWVLHIRSKAEQDWEAQRKRDNSNPALCAPVRHLDADGCRYCGSVTSWSGDRSSARAGTYDHRHPGRPATFETSVVACKSCNSRRGIDTREGRDPDLALPLKPPPPQPFYSVASSEYLARHGFTVQPTATGNRHLQR